MRKFLKDNILEIFKTLYEAHEIVQGFIDKKEYQNAQNLLVDCQDTAIQLGSIIGEVEGDSFITVSLLEEYCEELYKAATALSEEIAGHKVRKQLDDMIRKAENSVKNDIKVRLEVVFMPYKSSMWDSLESIWRAADEDPDCDAYVVPIPYYDRNPDHSLGQFHYEGNEYPDHVPVVHYNSYDLAARTPDVIYIHNPYDSYNYVTSVDPRFYSSELKKYTECLVYVPYFVVANSKARIDILGTAAGIYADKIILQSEALRTNALSTLAQSGYTDIEAIDKKIAVLGSPKLDSVVNARKESFSVPDSWEKLMLDKKVVLYNTSIASALEAGEAFLDKIERTLQTFRESSDMVLWWRPHPLLESTYESMRRDLVVRYRQILSSYRQQGYGILDESSQLQRALAYCDMYYGDKKSSVYTLFSATGKPSVYIDTDRVGCASDFEEDCRMTYRDNSDHEILNRSVNSDGTCGIKTHQYIKDEILK